jgi:DNA-binding NarL/FixJ family response regulator
MNPPSRGSSATPTADRLRILIADDHAIVREGLKRVLEDTSRQWEVAEADSGFTALELLRSGRFDVAIFDLSMPGMNGLELLRRVRQDHRKLPVLMLSMHAEDQYAIRALKAGANGYVTKDTARNELAAAVAKVLAGGAYISASLAERVVMQLNGATSGPAHADLTDREIEVLRRLVAGQRPTDIAEEMHLSVKTVSTHKANIQHKLGLASTAALIRYGLENGLGPDPPVSGSMPLAPGA